MLKNQSIKDAKILIVDDVPENIKVLANILMRHGAKISVANNGEAGVKAAQSILPDLILLDINMPIMDGYTACDLLKQDTNTQDIPIVFITARSETEDIVHGFDVGGVDYIQKPYNQAELISRVNTHIELSNALKELQNKNIELQKINNEKDKFLSLISHDLRSPFSGILGLVETIERDFEIFEKEELFEYITIFNKSLKNHYAFLENLLAWGNIQMGRKHADFERVLLNDIAKNKVLLLEQVSSNKQIKLLFSNEEKVDFYANCDVNMVSTVLHNLVSNAIKFTPNGGTIEIILKDIENNMLQVEVKDTGLGMTEEQRNKLFRLDTNFTTPGTNEESGTGLGLLLCLELINLNRGKIWVESEPGKGSSFFFTVEKSMQILDEEQD